MTVETEVQKREEFVPRPANATRKQAAQFLQLSERSVQNLEYRGLLKRVMIGSRVRYRWSDLEKIAKRGV